MLTFNIEFIVYKWIGEHVWYIGINMFIFSSLIHTVKELRYVWMSFLSTCVLCVELRHMCKCFIPVCTYILNCMLVPFSWKWRRARLSRVDLIVITLEKWLLKFQESLTKNMERITRKYAGMSMSVCFEFTPVSNIIPAFATLGSLQKEIMFLNWFLNDLPFTKLQPVWIWNFTAQV